MQNIKQSDIFNELEQLCQTQGYIYVIAYLVFSNNFTKLDPACNYHTRNEVALLIRLALKNKLDIPIPIDEKLINDNIGKTIELLSKLHISFFHDISDDQVLELVRHLESNNQYPGKGVFPDQMLGYKEPIFYAADYAYDFQYRDFAVERYQNDNDWIIFNKGFDVASTRNVIHALKKIHSKKFTELLEPKISQKKLDLARILYCFSFTLEEVIRESGCDVNIANKILKAFSSPTQCSSKFEKIGDYNEAISHPIIPLTNNEYILFQIYSLAESFYQSPIHWIGNTDRQYIDEAYKNRGKFTENFSASCIERVLGAKCIYKDVKIYDGKDVITDIDVLAIYADRAVIIQAKSKGLTELAKQGNEIKIKEDFQKAIQAAYNQGLKCAESLDKTNLVFKDSFGNKIDVNRKYREIFIICVTSEYYPSLNFQVYQFLQKQRTDTIHFPYIIDIFCLDTLCEMLNSPLYFFSFLNRRVTYDKKLICENELAILADHLKNNLYFSERFDKIILEESSQELDIAMSLRRESDDKNATPNGILTIFSGTILGKIIDQISKKKLDNILDFGYVLLNNPNLIDKISENIKKTMLSFHKDGKVHDFTVGFNEYGLTFFIGNPTKDALAKLGDYCHIKKYQQKLDKWFGCFLSKEYTIEAIVIQESKWTHSDEMDQYLKENPLRPKKMIVNKTGRNDPCVCGSGIKYKKCCLK